MDRPFADWRDEFFHVAERVIEPFIGIIQCQVGIMNTNSPDSF